MPLSSKNLIGVDPVLTNVSRAISQSSSVYLWSKVLPPLPSGGKQTGTYHIWGAETFMPTSSASPSGGDLQRSISGPFTRGKVASLSTGTFKCVEYGFEEPLDRTAKRRSDAVLNLEKNVNAAALTRVLGAQEQRMIDLAFSTGSVTQNTTLGGTAQWSDYANSDPVSVIETGIQTIFAATGLVPGPTHDLVAVTNEQVWKKLKWHPQLGGIKGSAGSQMVTPEDMMRHFGFTEFNVHYGLKNNVKDGQATSLARMLGKDMLIFFRARSLAPEVLTFGVSFVEQDLTTEVYEEPQIGSDIYRVKQSVDEVLFAASCGYLIKTAVA
jgi:hypothetical protein